MVSIIPRGDTNRMHNYIQKSLQECMEVRECHILPFRGHRSDREDGSVVSLCLNSY